ncbi:hypothetical protein CWI42_081490 [Ordospora colligata]|uniref:Uncharacterized protein n=1 Tax=Ordospora colligata OC4 TaxID=1354746 RepID=A0A0B2UK87_9MICR|nr:uncharacterized protein M896_081490 [Ordospora colligata OC4]KHN69410.1 hypothetical protein M896_081490 [Ordospora colligata OC4]TBU14924.1 hypothetical protein CWI41_081480 [Ordospora colligata]TBU15055.1 hypothetical protein CWI40_081500 [Ordospora colligata]TBU18309.1 hypothetical protein CWI42_081490 [Ordospora colligata]
MPLFCLGSSYELVLAAKDIFERRSLLVDASRTSLLLVFSGALLMVFQGQAYKNIALSIVIRLSMIAIDPTICTRIVQADEVGILSSIIEVFNRALLRELFFCALCICIAFVTNTCVVPILWLISAIVGSSLANKIFTSALVETGSGEIVSHFICFYALVLIVGRFEQIKNAFYAVFFSSIGVMLMWIVLEIILKRDLGVDAVNQVIWKSPIRIFRIPQAYPFIALMGIGVGFQMRMKGLFIAMKKWRRRMAVVIRKSENKIIEA